VQVGSQSPLGDMPTINVQKSFKRPFPARGLKYLSTPSGPDPFLEVQNLSENLYIEVESHLCPIQTCRKFNPKM